MLLLVVFDWPHDTSSRRKNIQANEGKPNNNVLLKVSFIISVVIVLMTMRLVNLPSLYLSIWVASVALTVSPTAADRSGSSRPVNDPIFTLPSHRDNDDRGRSHNDEGSRLSRRMQEWTTRAVGHIPKMSQSGSADRPGKGSSPTAPPPHPSPAPVSSKKEKKKSH